MKTTSTYWHNRKSPRSTRNDAHAAGDRNQNATRTQAEHQRDACEQELYRLRYGIERLLANKEQGDFREEGSQQQQQRYGKGSSPVGRMKSTMSNLMSMFEENCRPLNEGW